MGEHRGHDTAATVRLRADDERRLVRDIIGALGGTDEAATLQADLLTEGDLRGHASHGLQRLPNLVERVRRNLVNLRTTGSHDWFTEVALAVDGQHGLGPPVAMRAMDAIIGRAAEHGVAVCGISRANHLAMLAPYVEHAANEGLIGIATTTSEPLVHPWGGRTAVLGTNPLAIAVPTAQEPCVLDMSTGATSAGRIISAEELGELLPDGLAIDETGTPTTDPVAARRGAISPFGGPKGYGLAVALEMLVGALTISAMGTAVRGTLDADHPVNKGDVFLAIAPGVWNPAGGEHALWGFAEQLRTAPRAPHFEGIEVPGDRARARRERHLRDGVLIARTTWDEVTVIARGLGVAPPTVTEGYGT